MRLALKKYYMRKLNSECSAPSLEQEQITSLVPNFKRLLKTKIREVILRKEGISKVEEIEIGTLITEVEELGLEKDPSNRRRT